MRWIMFTVLWAATTTVVFGTADPNTSAASFGNAAVSKILNIDENGTLYCDLEDFPPIIGKNIPVKLKDLQPAASTEANRNIQAFLTALITRGDTKPVIKLMNIQRGQQSFCLRADIHINGNDVAQLLIKRGLAHRVLHVKEPQPQTASPQPGQPLTSANSPTAAPATAKNGYIASKSSKVFHRADCYHAKRIDPSKAVYFKTREEAIQSGRRPCKTCSP